MPDAKFTSAYTGREVESAIKKALPLESFEHSSDEVINGKVFHVLWKVKPTTVNYVSGFSINPENGRLVEVYSAAGDLSTNRYLTERDLISISEIDNLFN